MSPGNIPILPQRVAVERFVARSDAAPSVGGCMCEMLEPRYLFSGWSVDPGFGEGGSVIFNPGRQDIPADVIELADGSLLVAARTSTNEPKELYQRGVVLARYLADGTLDTSFGNNGYILDEMRDYHPQAWSLTQVVVQPDGKILCFGQYDLPGFMLARYNADGSVDTTFGDGGYMRLLDENGWYYAIAVREDGKILVAGSMGGEDSPVSGVWQLNSDGSLDDSFAVGGYAALGHLDANAHSITVTADGRMLLLYQKGAELGVQRLNADGSIDQSFGDGGIAIVRIGAWPLIGSIHVGGDGAITLVAMYGQPNDNSGALVARLSAGGSLDQGFGDGGVVELGERVFIADSAILSDGSILVSQGNGVINGMLHIATDGMVDLAFQAGAPQFVLLDDGDLILLSSTARSDMSVEPDLLLTRMAFTPDDDAAAAPIATPFDDDPAAVAAVMQPSETASFAARTSIASAVDLLDDESGDLLDRHRSDVLA